MNAIVRRKLPLAEPVDVLLADVAVRIQLTPTHHALAVSRYETVNAWIEREGSPLEDLVEIFYPQGSMGIGATIASKLETDEFDIDLIAQVTLPQSSEPHAILNILEAAIRGEPGSRYYDKARRCTRCIQIQYADGMHLDVTPMVRLPMLLERTGHIFHARDSRAQADDKKIVANPYGFAGWFKTMTPPENDFALAFAQREAAYDLTINLAEAEVEPVPAHAPAHEKSMAVIALQLLKRWRNIQYDARDGRRPASVMLARFVAGAANRTETLSEELLHQARVMLEAFSSAQQRRERIVVRNPTCESDIFTDRWPASLQEQGVFLDDLNHLVNKLEELQAGCTLATMREIMSELFGEQPTIGAIESLNRGNGNTIVAGSSQHVPGSGRFHLPGSSIIAAASSMPAVAAEVARATPKHTHFGGTESDT